MSEERLVESSLDMKGLAYICLFDTASNLQAYIREQATEEEIDYFVENHVKKLNGEYHKFFFGCEEGEE